MKWSYFWLKYQLFLISISFHEVKYFMDFVMLKILLNIYDQLECWNNLSSESFELSLLIFIHLLLFLSYWWSTRSTETPKQNCLDKNKNSFQLKIMLLIQISTHKKMFYIFTIGNFSKMFFKTDRYSTIINPYFRNGEFLK